MSGNKLQFEDALGRRVSRLDVTSASHASVLSLGSSSTHLITHLFMLVESRWLDRATSYYLIKALRLHKKDSKCSIGSYYACQSCKWLNKVRRLTQMID